MTHIYRSKSGQDLVETWCEAQFANWAVPHERHTISTNLGDSHLTIAGDGPITAVYVPGTNFNTAANLNEISHLTPHFRVVAVDVPGQPGLSSAQRPGGDRIATLGGWLDQVIDQLEGPVTVVGHSMGAAVVLATRSDQINGRVVFSPAGMIRMRVPPGILLSTMSWLTRSTTSSSHKLLSHMCAPGAEPTKLQTEWITLVGQTTRSSLAPPKFHESQLAELSGTRISLASGRHDRFLPPHLISRRSTKLFNVETTTLNGGHLCDQEALDYLVREIQGINQLDA